MASTKRRFPTISTTTLLLCILTLAPFVYAKIEYYLSSDKICRGKGTFQNCESNAGLCAYDDLLDHAYCCHADYPVCTIWGQECQGDDDRAAAGQTKCKDSYCCINQKERCTQRAEQTNICWASFRNPYSDTSIAVANRTFDRFKRFQPNQSTRPMTFGGSRTASSDTTSSPTSTSEAARSGGSRRRAISGGAIAGIVVGALAAVALLLGGGFLLGKRYLRKKAQGDGKSKGGATAESAEFIPHGGAAEMSQPTDGSHLAGATGAANSSRVDEKRAPPGSAAGAGYYAVRGESPGPGAEGQRNELGADGMRVEADGREVISEMPGSIEPVHELDAGGGTRRAR
ncbi:MAG: hypothetical protein M1831_006074 [Alyxoria varia]|nr:MAG: hypothetical protein M1831_006074 [Alyxoria varia]